MPRLIVLDSFPLSCVGKNNSNPPTLTDQCREWVINCVSAGNPVRVPAIIYYETLRELERLNAPAQIPHLKGFCFSDPQRFLLLETVDLEDAARLWAQSRNAGMPTSSPDALDGDMILAAQALRLGLDKSAYVVATTNVSHLIPFVSAEHWTAIAPGS
jgi:predicted nucleic acid-binding protein